MKAMSDLDKGVAFRKNKGKSGTEDNLFAFVTPFQQSEQRTNLGRPWTSPCGVRSCAAAPSSCEKELRSWRIALIFFSYKLRARRSVECRFQRKAADRSCGFHGTLRETTDFEIVSVHEQENAINTKNHTRQVGQYRTYSLDIIFSTIIITKVVRMRGFTGNARSTGMVALGEPIRNNRYAGSL